MCSAKGPERAATIPALEIAVIRSYPMPGQPTGAFIPPAIELVAVPNAQAQAEAQQGP
jgi:hypothetical protein